MESAYKKLLEAIGNSNLNPSQQREMNVMVMTMTEEDTREFYDLVSEDAKWVDKIYENYKAKKDALQSGDAGLWREIVEQEGKDLADMQIQELKES